MKSTRILVAINPQSKEEHPRVKTSIDKAVAWMNEDYITHVSEEIEIKQLLKISRNNSVGLKLEFWVSCQNWRSFF